MAITMKSLFGAALRPGVNEEYEKYMDLLNKANTLGDLQRHGSIGKTTATGTSVYAQQMHAQNRMSGIVNSSKISQPQYNDPNTLPEMQMSPETAHDMWRVRWGEDWVKPEPVQDAGDGLNWLRLAYRLERVRLLESDSTSGYYKLVPNSIWK